MLGPDISLSAELKDRKGYQRGFSRVCRNMSYYQSHSLKADYMKALVNDDLIENYKNQETQKLHTIRTMIAQKVCGFLDDPYEDNERKNNFFSKKRKREDQFYTNNSHDLRSFSNISPIPNDQSAIQSGRIDKKDEINKKLS